MIIMAKTLTREIWQQQLSCFKRMKRKHWMMGQVQNTEKEAILDL